MARTVRFSQVLWIVTTAWLAACGRIGFGDGGDRTNGELPDAAVGSPPPGDGAVSVPDAPPGPVGPMIQVAPPAAAQTPCGGTASVIVVPIQNTGDQDLVIFGMQATNGFVPDQIKTALTIAPGTTHMLHVAPPSATVGTDIGGTQKTGQLQLTTNVSGQATLSLPLVADVVGANITAVTVSHGTGNNLVFEANNSRCPAQQTITLQIDHVAGGVVIPIRGVAGFVLSGFSGGTVASDGAKTVVVNVAHPSTCASGAAISIADTRASGICQIAAQDVNLSFNFASGTTACFCS